MTKIECCPKPLMGFWLLGRGVMEMPEKETDDKGMKFNSAGGGASYSHRRHGFVLLKCM